MCAAALLRRGGEVRALGLGGKRGRLSAAAPPVPRCPAGGRCPAGAAAPLRCHAALMFAAATRQARLRRAPHRQGRQP
eukprot:scaffold12667_cov50-Phaeocystis_antarctica.AAC.2